MQARGKAIWFYRVALKRHRKGKTAPPPSTDKAIPRNLTKATVLQGDKSMLKEFRGFAMRGNAIDMVIGIIIGSAFGAIVNSLVNDIIMPPIGLLLGDVDFTDL